MTGFILPDLLSNELKIIFCGCAASKESARLRQYYAGPGNKFWKIIFEIGLIDRLLAPSEFQTLLSYKIGLTDIVKHNSGNDAVLSGEDFDRDSLHTKIKNFGPGILCFNGKRAAKEFLNRDISYGLQPESIDNTRLFVAPSTSGSACRFWDSKVWHNLATLCQ